MPLIWLFVALANDNCVKMQESFPIIPIPIDRPIVASRSPDRPISDFCVNSAALHITVIMIVLYDNLESTYNCNHNCSL